MKVGSRVTPPTPLMVHVSKRLQTMAETIEAPLSAAEGIIAGLNKHGSMLASVGNREGIQEVTSAIAPFTAVVELANKTIR